MKLLHRLPPIPSPTPRNLWLLLAALVAWQNLWLLYATQESTKVLIFVLLLWWGALTCMEDRLEALRPHPSPYSLVLGSVLLLWSLWRSQQVLTLDSVVYVLTPIQGLALSLLCVPIRRLRLFSQQLIVLLLLPFFSLATLQSPLNSFLDHWLSPWTAFASAGFLSVLGINVISDGRVVMTPTGGVTVSNACSGIDQIGQVLAIALIFFMAFPLRTFSNRMLLLIASVVIPSLVNSFRIGILAQIVSMEGSGGSGGWWFDFFHEEMGSLIFSGLSVFLFGALYLWAIEREIGPPSAPRI
jgi:cyanoexosortase A